MNINQPSPYSHQWITWQIGLLLDFQRELEQHASQIPLREYRDMCLACSARFLRRLQAELKRSQPDSRQQVRESVARIGIALADVTDVCGPHLPWLIPQQASERVPLVLMEAAQILGVRENPNAS
jgi:hypothetical protein